MYYVYTWSKPGNIPFYIGLGRTVDRWNPLYARTRNPHCRRTVQLVGSDNISIAIIENLSKQDACRIEQTLIAYYGRRDIGAGPLTNMTDGGEGIQNVSIESRKKISDAHKKIKEKQADRIRGDKNPMRNPDIYAHAVSRMNDPEVIAKYSGDRNPSKRPEVRAKLKSKWDDPEFRAARIAEKVGRPIHSEESKEIRRQKLLDPSNPMREQHKVLNSDPEIKEKRLAALLNPEVQAKIKDKLNDPEAKARRIAKLRETQSSPEWKAKHGKRSEETKAKMAASAKARWAIRKQAI